MCSTPCLPFGRHGGCTDRCVHLLHRRGMRQLQSLKLHISTKRTGHEPPVGIASAETGFGLAGPRMASVPGSGTPSMLALVEERRTCTSGERKKMHATVPIVTYRLSYDHRSNEST